MHILVHRCSVILHRGDFAAASCSVPLHRADFAAASCLHASVGDFTTGSYPRASVPNPLNRLRAVFATDSCDAAIKEFKRLGPVVVTSTHRVEYEP